MQEARKHPLGAIYTSETQLTRALAGEIRHAPRAMEQYFQSCWNLYIERGGASMPGITIVSPIHPNGSQLCGQIQVTGRSMPKLLDEVELEFYAGTRVSETEQCFPKPESNIVPQWVSNARVLYESVLEKDPAKFNLKTRAPGTSRRPLGSRRKQLTKKYLPDQQWLAQGYIEWSLGVRTYPRPISEIDELAAETMKLFTSWFAALKNN
ncbi:hypothetical protein [Varibaculum massiliense]|uniref:hypothetical protein n=1 Tax=Varibaculum massiliense TaxID=1852372 RepID=UPI0008D9D9E2|nr:hypothetical protein [Varibaculum massiliense]